jgi:hypothetical protein
MQPETSRSPFQNSAGRDADISSLIEIFPAALYAMGSRESKAKPRSEQRVACRFSATLLSDRNGADSPLRSTPESHTQAIYS